MDMDEFCRFHARASTLAGKPMTAAEILAKASREGIRTCDACPDGHIWTKDGPTDATCPKCHGFARLIGGLAF